MASEYLKWKYRDVKPDPPPRELTKKEKFLNFLDYYKWWLVVGAIGLLLLGNLIWSVLGIGEVRPDYSFAYVSKSELPPAQAETLETALATLGEDVNGDGQVVAELHQYVQGPGGDPETALYMQYAGSVTLIADIEAGESFFFLTDDPEELQNAYQLYAFPDGTPPAEDDYQVADKVIRWADSPALAGLEVDQAAMEGIYIGRRVFYEDTKTEKHGPSEALWNVILEGAGI